MNKYRIYFLTELLFVLVICFFPLCYRMDTLAIRQWDEARNAVHTVEMLENHNYIVRYFEGKPEVWEPKPPLMIWLQVISSQIFGLNELAIRFPVILASCLTIIMLILYFNRYYNRYIGYLAALILVTSQGFVEVHVARTGDHDTLLVFFMTAILLLFYRYLISAEPRRGLLIGIAILFILGVYTKSVAALFITPGLLISIFLFRSGRKLFTDRYFYIALGLFILITGSYYVTREIMQPGYLNAVWDWELFPRFTNSENQFNTDSFWFYFRNYFEWRYTYWIWFLLASIILLPFLLKNEIRRFYFYLFVNAAVFLTIISMGSKGTWYDAVLYPVFAIIIGLFLYSVLTKISVRIPGKVFRIALVIIIIVLFYYPYASIIKKVRRTGEFAWDREYYSMSYILRDKKRLQTMPDPLKVVFEGYNAHLLFYAKARNYESNRERITLTGISGTSSGDTILISQKQVLDSLATLYDYKILFENQEVKLVLLEDE